MTLPFVAKNTVVPVTGLTMNLELPAHLDQTLYSTQVSRHFTLTTLKQV